MNTHIQIRNVDKALHRKLKISAAAKDLSLSDYVKQVLAENESKPSLAEISEGIAKLPPTQVTTEDIVRGIREDRDRH